MRCVHLDRAGRQCPAEALEGDVFCVPHSPDRDPDLPESKTSPPYHYRLVALLLLLIFLFNAYQTVREWLGG